MHTFHTTSLQRQAPGGERTLTSLLTSLALVERQTQALYGAYLQRAKSLPGLTRSALRRALSEDRLHCAELKICLRQRPSNPSREQRLDHDPAWAPPRTRERAPGSILVSLRRGEQYAVQIYSRVCALTLEYDYRLFDLAFRNLQDNLQHLEFINELSAQGHTGAPGPGAP